MNTEKQKAIEKAWIKVEDAMPINNLIVNTKIDDENGVRNVQQLMLRNKLWWLPDGSMYVYYAPTHWQRV